MNMLKSSNKALLSESLATQSAMLGLKMRFKETYKIVIGKWPDVIDISKIKFHSNGGASIPSLSEAHDGVENQCLNLGKKILAMDWSIFQVLHSEAQKLHKAGVYSLVPKNVDKKEIKMRYIENKQ